MTFAGLLPSVRSPMSSPATAVDVIALGTATFGEPESGAIEEVFRSGWGRRPQGPTGKRFEEAFARSRPERGTPCR